MEQKKFHLPHLKLFGNQRLSRLLTLLALATLLLGLGTKPVLGAPAKQEEANPEQSASSALTITRVETPRMFRYMGQRSLRMDSTSNHYPHVAYGGNFLYYASYDATGWHTQIVDSTPGVGTFTSLALDSSNNPHISYYDAVSGSLKYAHYTGSSWSIQTIDSGPGNIALLSPAQENYDGENPPLASSDLREWRAEMQAAINPDAPESVDSTGVGLYSSIAIDGFGHPSISYYDSINGDLKYAHFDGNQWNIQVVDDDNNTGMYTSLAMDSSNNPNISYYDETNGDLRFVRWTGTAWSYKNVDSAGNVGKHTSIALDSSNNPYISYHDETNGDLKCAWASGSTWTIKTADTDGNSGLYSSIMTVGGKPQIAYYDATNGRLKYTRWNGSAWETQTLTSNASGLYISMDQ